MKRFSISLLYQSRVSAWRTRAILNIFRILPLVLSLNATNVLSAQQTLCQQIGGNFIPDIIIGVSELSVTNTSSLDLSGWTNKKVFIHGALVVDTDFQIHTCTLSMGKNATIIINNGKTLNSYFSRYFRCGSNTWAGFVAFGNCNLFCNHIEDAGTAMEIRNTNAGVILVANNFNRNNRGLVAQNIVVNAMLAGNIFNCSTPVNGTNTPLALAGIQLTNCPAASIGFTNHVPGHRNIFKKQTNGIRLNNTTASIGLSSFNDNLTGISIDKSNVIIRGADTDLNTQFSKNGNDIYSFATSLRVSLCYFDSCKNNNITARLNNNREQILIYENTIHITNQPEPGNFKTGISLDRSRLGNDHLFRNTIDRNHLIIHDFAGNNRSGIHIKGGAATHDFMRIDSNRIEVMQGGNSVVQTRFMAIDISGADNFNVTRNTLKSTNTFSSGNNRWGIFMVNGASSPAAGNTLWNNIIQGIGPDDGCCAIHAEDAGPWSICSNTTDQTYRGFHFIGNCGKTSLDFNIIRNHNLDPLQLYVGGTGLFLQGHGADNVFLGDQECRSNYWSLTDYPLTNAYPAIMVGENLQDPGTDTVKKNEFYVENITDPHEAPTDRSPMVDWFQPGKDCIQTSFQCMEGLPIKLDEQDKWICNHYPVPQNTPVVEEWQSTRYLLAKLMRYPELVAGEALAFKSVYNQSSAALFAVFDSLINTLAFASSGVEISLNDLEKDIQKKQLEINALDAGISGFENIPPGVRSDRWVLLGQLAALSDQRSGLLTQNTNEIERLLNACEEFNNTLPENEMYEQNQKLLNALIIQQMRGMELSQTDKLALHTIAQQCTQVAGRTKSAAAGMLSPAEGERYWRENPDADNCLQRTKEYKNLPESCLSIAPNPCKGVLNIQFDTRSKGEIVISGLSGKRLQVVPIHTEVTQLEIRLANPQNGVYILSFTDSSGRLRTNSRFVVLL